MSDQAKLPAGPWERYAAPAATAKPWERYGQPPPIQPRAVTPPAADEGGSFFPEAGKAIAAGAVNTVGTMAKGLAAEQAASPAEDRAVAGLVPELARIPQMSNSEWVDFQRRASTGIRGLKEMDLLAIASQIRNGTMTLEGAPSMRPRRSISRISRRPLPFRDAALQGRPEGAGLREEAVPGGEGLRGRMDARDR